MTLPVVLVFYLIEDGNVIEIPKFTDGPFFDGCFDRALGFVSVGAVSEFTVLGCLKEFKTLCVRSK